jgi:Fe-S-cluster containining protein
MKCTRCGKCCSSKGFTKVYLEDYKRIICYNKLHFKSEDINKYFEFYLEKHVFLNTIIEIPRMNIKKENNICVFYNVNAGCGIQKIKPFICRSFPYNYTVHSSRINKLFVESICETADMQKINNPNRFKDAYNLEVKLELEYIKEVTLKGLTRYFNLGIDPILTPIIINYNLNY